MFTGAVADGSSLNRKPELAITAEAFVVVKSIIAIESGD